MQRAEFGARVDAQFLREPFRQLPVGRERLVLPPRTVERPHPGRVQPLPERMLRDQRAQFVGQYDVFAQLQPCLGEVLLRGDPPLLQPDGLGPYEGGVREVGVGGTPPQPECLRQQRGPRPRPVLLAGERGQFGEPARVHRFVGHPERITRRTEPDQGPAALLGPCQDAPQLGDLGLQGVPRVARQVLAPQLVDQPVHGHGPPVPHEQSAQQRPDLRLGHGDGGPLVGSYGQWSQHLETHAATLLLPRQQAAGRTPVAPEPRASAARARPVRHPCVARARPLARCSCDRERAVLNRTGRNAP